MAVVTELLKNGALIRQYSDSGMMLRQIETGILYSEAVDTEPCRYTYEETDVPVESAEN